MYIHTTSHTQKLIRTFVHFYIIFNGHLRSYTAHPPQLIIASLYESPSFIPVKNLISIFFVSILFCRPICLPICPTLVVHFLRCHLLLKPFRFSLSHNPRWKHRRCRKSSSFILRRRCILRFWIRSEFMLAKLWVWCWICIHFEKK